MKKIVFIALIIILLVTFLNPKLSGEDLGNEIIGPDGWFFSSLSIVSLGAEAVMFVGNLGRNLIIGVSEIFDEIASFFGWAKDKPKEPAT